MTIEKLADYIFKTSGYKVNYQDVKSRIENMCIKYKKGEFEISYDTDNVTKRNWFEKLPLHWRYLLHTAAGLVLGLTIAYIC